MSFEIMLQNFQGNKLNSIIHSDNIDDVLAELKVLFNHFNVIKIKKIKDK
jgi:hypothetical protein